MLEANIIYALLYEGKLNTKKFSPVLFSPADRRFILSDIVHSHIVHRPGALVKESAPSFFVPRSACFRPIVPGPWQRSLR